MSDEKRELKKYQVTSYFTANVKTVEVVEASSPEEASDLAVADPEYQGVITKTYWCEDVIKEIK